MCLVGIARLGDLLDALGANFWHGITESRCMVEGFDKCNSQLSNTVNLANRPVESTQEL